MQRKYIILILIAGSLLNGMQGFSQESMSLYFLENIPQSNLLNPAMAPRCNGYFGVPGVNAIYTNLKTDLTPKAFLQDSDSGIVSLTSKYFDFDKMNRILGKGISLRNYTMISPLNFGFRGKDGYYSFTLSEKIKLNGTFPTDFLNILDKGLADGSTFDFSKIGINAQIYQEYAFGYSRNLISNLRVGAKFKVLQGFYSMKTDIKTFELNTSKKLWDVGLEADILTSAPLEVSTDENGMIDSIALSEEYKNKSEVDILLSTLSSFANRGFAFDLGAVYDLNQRWTFSASIVDLGYIKWRKDLNSFHFNSSYDFDGLDINGSNMDSIDNALSDLLDSIGYMEGHAGNKKFSTGLGTTVYLGGQFHVNHYFTAGLVSRTIFDKNFFHQTFNLSANLNLYHFLTTNLNYNLSFSGEQYAGLGLAFKFLPVQFYLLLDNIPITFTNYKIDDSDRFFAPYEIRSFNIMLGFNFIFGVRGYKDHPKIDAYSEF